MENINTNNQAKQALAQHVLDLSGYNPDVSLFAHVDGTHPGVRVPFTLKRKEHVVLQFGKTLPVPIPDLLADEVGLNGTLSFRGVRFSCHIPWEALYGISDGNLNSRYWPEDMPKSVLKMFHEASAMAARAVTAHSNLGAPEEEHQQPRKSKITKALPPYLRVVK